MKKLVYTFAILMLLSPIAISQNLSDNFNDGNYIGWFDLMSNGANSWQVENNELHVSYQTTEEVPAVLLSPVGSVTDFSFELQGGVHSLSDWCNEAGIARFSDADGRNIIWRIDVEEGILELVYNDGNGDIELFSEYISLSLQLYSMKLEVSGTAPTLSVTAWWDGIQKYSGTISNASESLAQGQLAILVSNHANEAVSMWFDNISIEFESYITSNKSIETTSTKENILMQNSPNPFTTETNIKFETTQNSKIQLNIMDLNGRIVRKILNATKPAGNYEVVWDGKDELGNRVASGSYYYQLISGNVQEAKQMLFLE